MDNQKEIYKMIKDPVYQFHTHADGKVLHGRKKGRLPAMGWNSWNAFGSGNNEELTKQMADAFLKLGLKDIGYQYIVLDDGCYKPERVDGKLSNDEVKFPSGFKALSDLIHEKGLQFGMYNDIGTNLCAGAAVGTYGHEQTDAASYLEWGVDFLKVDNCYNLWDNATFSDPTNARYTYAPNIREVIVRGDGFENVYSAVKDGVLAGKRARKTEQYVTEIGTFDGTGPEHTPIGEQYGELLIEIDVPVDGDYEIIVSYAAGEEEGTGSYLQMKVGENEAYLYDDLVPETGGSEHFMLLSPVKASLQKGINQLYVMNHRRQENTLTSYGILAKELQEQDPDHDMVLSICEWGKTQPQNWGYKVGDSWRILNDITFQVGADGDPGVAAWSGDYTNNLTAQYNKAVIMDEYAGLLKGWNDPDMMMIGMDGLNAVQNKTHMTMWCMMNSPLMLGLDLRRVEKGDTIWNIIANADLIALNQDLLGIQAKRVACRISGKDVERPDESYIRDIDRVDILAKPLADGSVAVSFINVSEKDKEETFSISMTEILNNLSHKMTAPEAFRLAKGYTVQDLWTKEKSAIKGELLEVHGLKACDSVTFRVSADV